MYEFPSSPRTFADFRTFSISQGPSVAIPKVLARAGITKDDVDLWEVNEAFASMYSYMIDVFGLPLDRTNVNGGAIALGHPLGVSTRSLLCTRYVTLSENTDFILFLRISSVPELDKSLPVFTSFAEGVGRC